MSILCLMLLSVLYAQGQTPIRIDFETVPDNTVAEGLMITNQFSASTGMFFTRAGEQRTFITEVGDPAIGFASAFGGDTPAPNQDVGNFFLTDDGSVDLEETAPLLVTSVRLLEYIEGVILDIDSGEIFTIDAFDEQGNILETIILDADSPNVGDGLATPWRFEVNTCMGIRTVRIDGESNGNTPFDFGLDNIVFQYMEVNPGNRIEATVINTTCGQENGVIQLESNNPQSVAYALNGSAFQAVDSFSRLAEGAYTILVRNSLGCLDSIFTTVNAATIVDECGVCLASDDPAFNQSCADCAGIPNGPAQIDECGDCLDPSDPRFGLACSFENKLYIPNAFSPNGDGRNDVFRVFPNDEASAIIDRFAIFSRWGDLVYDQSDMDAATFNQWWDGTLRGNELAAGVYMYAIQVTFPDGATERYEGEVLLVR